MLFPRLFEVIRHCGEFVVAIVPRSDVCALSPSCTNTIYEGLCFNVLNHPADLAITNDSIHSLFFCVVLVFVLLFFFLLHRRVLLLFGFVFFILGFDLVCSRLLLFLLLAIGKTGLLTRNFWRGQPEYLIVFAFSGKRLHCMHQIRRLDFLSQTLDAPL